MRFQRLVLGIVLLPLALAPLASAQTPARVYIQRSGDNPIYKITINVVERQTTAVNYRHRGGSTRLDFRGTPLLPAAHGEAEEARRLLEQISPWFDRLRFYPIPTDRPRLRRAGLRGPPAR